MIPRTRSAALLALAAWQFGLTALPARAQADAAAGSAAEPAAPAAKASNDEPLVLSPFTVTTDKDKGYKATNATSGTRLNTPIKELPMPLAVITDQFIRDTGATDLRRGLAYTAGIQLQSQNDQGTPGGAYQGPGGVNNPEGATANATGTSYKIRGYVTDNVLRDGFRRQNATDSINIQRIEVAFGPTALLYGIGSFGGIVNYLPKAPQAKQSTDLGLSVGSYNLIRTTLDTTGPISKSWDFNYRVTGAWQQHEDYTDFRKHDHYFVSPAFSFKPTKSTQVDIDYELGEQNDKGVGFQRVRAMSGVGVNNDQNEHADFYTLPGTNPREFRWSGPDTYIDNKSNNFRAQLGQKIGDHIDLLIGYNRAYSEWDRRDVNGNLFQNQGPAALQKTVNFGTPSLSSVGSSNLNVVNGTVDKVVLGYAWGQGFNSVLHDQVRAEGNFKLTLFDHGNKWLKMQNSLLIGHSQEKQVNKYNNVGTPDNQFNYKSPLDASPIRFGKQGDGSNDIAMIKKNDGYTNAFDQATYLVYSGRLLDDRVFIVAGSREDHSDTFVHYHSSEYNSMSDTRSPKQEIRTNQYGISLAIDPQRHFSVFALKAEGVQPNYSGARDTTGAPMKAVMAKSTEYGVKFDLFDGRLSGSVGAFKIKRTGTPLSYWWAPTSNNITFNPNKDIVYNVSNFSPSSVPGGSNGGNGAADASLAQWNSGVSAGAIYQKNGSWYVNASKPTGAAYLDAVFDYTKNNKMTWPGWLYIYDGETNNAWNDIAASKGESVVGSDQAEGWSVEFLYRPNDNFQLLANYAHTEKIITSAGQFAKYPYPQDKWAVWYFPNTDWGLTGKPLSTVYTNAQDTSTWTGIGYGTGEKQDDTPEHAVNVWGNYVFTDGSLKGFSFGLGGQWESPREYQSGITHGGGQRVTDKNGNIIVLKTDSRLTVNALAKYEFTWSGRKSAVQLNIDNLLDDQHRYGLIYAAPRTWRLEFTTQL